MLPKTKTKTERALTDLEYKEKVMEFAMHIYNAQPAENCSLRQASDDAQQQYHSQKEDAFVKLSYSTFGRHIARQKLKSTANEEKSLLNKTKTEYILSFLVEMSS